MRMATIAHPHVWPRTRRTQVGTSGGAADAARYGVLAIAHAFLLLSVEIRVGRNSQRRCGFDELLRDWMLIGATGNLKGAANAAPVIAAIQIILHTLEVRQYVRVSPPVVARSGPIIVVASVSTHMLHTINGT